MGKGKGKTTGSGYINGSVNNNGGHVEAGGKVSHKNKNTNVYAEGSISHDRHHPTRGKGQTGGRVEIGFSHDF